MNFPILDKINNKINMHEKYQCKIVSPCTIDQRAND